MRSDARAEAIELLARADWDAGTGENWYRTPEEIRERHRRVVAVHVDALLAAGWRPPARVIKSMDEMEALPMGAIVRWGHHVEQSIGSGWLMTPSDPVSCEAVFEAAQGVDDITVVWEPEETSDE